MDSANQKTFVNFATARAERTTGVFLKTTPDDLTPYPPAKTCGRTPLSDGRVFPTDPDRERTRPGGRVGPDRRLKPVDVLEVQGSPARVAEPVC